MPRYFFNTFNSSSHIDDEGIELVSDEEAWEQGLQFCGAWLRDHARTIESGATYRFECSDGAGEDVFFVHFEAVRKRRPAPDSLG